MQTASRTRLWRAPLALLMVLTASCCKPLPPQEPRVVTVRESCLRVIPPRPHAEEILDCLTLGKTLDDCTAYALKVRDVWIADAWARCRTDVTAASKPHNAPEVKP